MARKLFGTDGIRGTANSEPMTPETALKVAMAVGECFQNGAHKHLVVIGKDTRLSGYMLEPALTAGFVTMGMDVVLVAILLAGPAGSPAPSETPLTWGALVGSGLFTIPDTSTLPRGRFVAGVTIDNRDRDPLGLDLMDGAIAWNYGLTGRSEVYGRFIFNRSVAVPDTPVLPPPPLDQILAPGGLRPVFQPIYRITAGGKTLHGLECLTRGPRGTNAESAAVLFEYVRRKREEIVVDRACILAAFCASRELGGAPRLSINAHASTLARDPHFPQFLEDAARKSGIACERLTPEIGLPRFRLAGNE